MDQPLTENKAESIIRESINRQRFVLRTLLYGGNRQLAVDLALKALDIVEFPPTTPD